MRVSNSALRTPQLQRLLGSALLTIRAQNYWSSHSFPTRRFKITPKQVYLSQNVPEGRVESELWNQLQLVLIRLIQAFSSWLCGIGPRGSALVADIALQTSRLTRRTPGNAHSCYWKARFLFKCLAVTSFESWLYIITSQFHLLPFPLLNLLSLHLTIFANNL